MRVILPKATKLLTSWRYFALARRGRPLKLTYLFLDKLEFRRVYPNVFPVAISNPWCYPRANGVQHILCDIRALGAYCAIASEIVSYNARVWSDIPKVGSIPAVLQEQQAVKSLKK